ncbi:MAG: hypothetical protein J0M12_16660 [Deltaproteobacteria bacterium]|nr:hypothetical protein [Deltaproteobacteria bacterium]
MGAIRKHNSMRSADGFSLIEVVFAVLILASSLVTLLGLQSSSLQLSAHSKFTQRAMLIAREILAPIETSRDPIEIQDIEGTPEEILEKVLAARLPAVQNDSKNTMYRVRLQVEYWGIPNLNEQAMKRITLTVRWSASQEDTFQIIYFMPNEGDQSASPEEVP